MTGHVVVMFPGAQNGFKTDLLLKDMNLGRTLADGTGAPASFTGRAAELYERMSAMGWGDKDFSAVYKHFERQDTV